MMRKLMICGLLLLCSCSFHSGRSKTDVVSDRITSKFSREMLAHDLCAVGTGGGQKDGKINLVDITFMTERFLNIDKARDLMVSTAGALLDMINDNPKNEQWFVEFPVTAKYLGIIIISREHSEYKDDDIDSVMLINNNVCYESKDPRKNLSMFEWLHKETFEEAVEILKKQEKEKRSS